MKLRLYSEAILPSTIVDSDPNTTTWGISEEGYTWYNTTEHKKKMWNGTEIVLLG